MNTESLHHQTRSEHSRSIEDAEKFKAIDTLVELGALIRVADLDVYHGRVGNATAGEHGSDWSVDPDFANGGNDSGNDNINRRPTLYTADEQTARDFAEARLQQMVRPAYDEYFKQRVMSYGPAEKAAWLQREKDRLMQQRGEVMQGLTVDDLSIGAEANRLERAASDQERAIFYAAAKDDMEIELHKIVVEDPDATIINLSFYDSDLTTEQKARYKEAKRTLAKLTTIDEGSPADFTNKDVYDQFMVAFQDREEVGYNSTSAINDLAQSSDVSLDVATKVASAYNTCLLATHAPGDLAARLLRSDGHEIEGVNDDVPLNAEYAQRYFRNAHIVGAHQLLRSGTLGRAIDSYSFFDLYKVDGETSAATKRAKVAAKLGPVVTTVEELHPFEQVKASPVVRVLENPHARPEAIVAVAMKAEGFAEVFAADAGNHEGFTLAEHTETVLRNFDENYANTLPVQLLAPIRLALLVHDIGKPQSFAEGKKHEQKSFTAVRAKEFMDKTGIEDSLQTLVLAVITEGAELAAKVLRSRDPEAVHELQMFAALTLIQATGEYAVDADEAAGLMEVCKIVEICDGGAYTSMALTRSRSGVKYRNYPAFNGSFKPAAGFGDRLLQPNAVE